MITERWYQQRHCSQAPSPHHVPMDGCAVAQSSVAFSQKPLLLMAPRSSLPKHAPWGASAQAWENMALFRPDQGINSLRSLAKLCPWTTSCPFLVLTFMNMTFTAPPGLHQIPGTETLSAFLDPLTGSDLYGHSCSSLVTIAEG